MTVSSSTNKFRYEGNGVTDTFAFTGRVFSASDLIVEIILRADDSLVETLTITTDYSVTINGAESASVQVTNVSKIPSATQDIQIRRSLAQTQTLDIPTGSVFPAVSVETSLDRLTALVQDLSEEVDRSLKISVTSSDDSITFPSYSSGALLSWSTATSSVVVNSTKTLAQVETAVDAVAALSAGSGVLVSSNDSTVGYLNGKLVGSGITLTENNDGSNETLTLSIADDAITLAKMAPGTDGNLITYDASGNPAYVATGNSGQVLTSNGAGAAPTFQTLSTGSPLGYKYGGILSNGTDADHDIDVSAGVFRDAADAADISLSAITKQIDATWAAGTNAGGLSSSLTAPANNTWYHVFAIIVGGNADVGFDTSITAANLVTDHSATAYRYLGSVLTDGSANIIAFKQYGNRFDWVTPPLSYSSSQNTTAALRTMTVPTGFKFKALLTVAGTDGHTVYISNPDQTDSAPSTTAAPLNSYDSNVAVRAANPIDVITNASSQVRARATGTVTNLYMVTRGWEVTEWP